LLRPEPNPSRNLEKFRAYTQSWLRPAADPDGAEFNVWQSDEGPPSHSIPPHLVAKAAARLGEEAFARIHERLLEAYFVESIDITDWSNLERIWREAELPAEALAVAHEPQILDEVMHEFQTAMQCGATGIPAVRLEGNDAVIVGAHPEALYRRWIERALEQGSA
jgi:predicted DsbA family dithiol-disulfide isomerase